jgi:tetratricopeptide (TPR) repeat protein
MGFRFFKRMNILPGVTLNLSKSGGSVSVGPHGARFTLGPQGSRITLGIPGSGLFYTTNFSLGKLGKLFGQSSEPSEAADAVARSTPTGVPTPAETPAPVQRTKPTVREKDRLTPSFFEKLSPPSDQKALADGCQALASGNEDVAFDHLQQAVHLADGAFLAGFLALKKGKLAEATQYLTTAAGQEQELGHYLSHYGIAATMSLAITEEVSAHVGPDMRGVLLALAEAYQAQERRQDAVACLERLRQLEPGDVVVKLSLAELLMENSAGNRETDQQVVQLTEGVENDSPVHTALLLYKAKALHELNFLDAALEVLSDALKRKKDRSDELLHAVRYERALVYEGLGQNRRARTELEKLYAEAPGYEDVAARLERTS